MLELISQAKKRLKEDPTSILDMYKTIDDYLLTDMTISEISYLATQAIKMDFSGEI